MFKGQLQCSDKFIPNERSCSAENGFEVVFSKFGFVSQIQASDDFPRKDGIICTTVPQRNACGL